MTTYIWFAGTDAGPWPHLENAEELLATRQSVRRRRLRYRVYGVTTEPTQP
jgi:hypothetical protein